LGPQKTSLLSGAHANLLADQGAAEVNKFPLQALQGDGCSKT
jgi:hypothetical protein